MFMRLISFFRSLFTPLNKAACRIVEIDTSAQLVIIHVVNKAISIKSKFSEAVADLTIIDNLPPGHACWLGGCYGRALRASVEGRGALKQVKKMEFLLSNRFGRYKIIFQNRNGDIGYIDKKSKQEFIESPLTIVRNNYVISEFDPRQACYLGILAGIAMERAISHDGEIGQVPLEEILKKPPKLRVVK